MGQQFAEYMCEYCSKSFQGRTRDRKNGNARFCSRKCNNDSQRTIPRGIEHAIMTFSHPYGRFIRTWKTKDKGLRKSCFNAVWIWRRENGWLPLPVDRDGKSFQVHHIDGNRLNDEIENLTLLSPAEHTALHRKESREENHRWLNGIELRRCSNCKKWKPLNVFHLRKKNELDSWQSNCKQCSKKVNKERNKNKPASKKRSLKKLENLLKKRRQK